MVIGVLWMGSCGREGGEGMGWEGRGLMDRWMDGWIDGSMDGWMGGSMHGDGWMDGWVDGWWW